MKKYEKYEKNMKNMKKYKNKKHTISKLNIPRSHEIIIYPCKQKSDHMG